MFNKKFLIVGGVGLAYLFYRETQNLKTTINGLALGFLPGGMPRFEGGKVIFPISVQVKNPGLRAIPLDFLRVNLHRVNTNGTSYPIASTPAAGVKLEPFAAQQTTTFNVDIEVGLLDAVSELYTTFQKRGFNKFRIDSTVGAGSLLVTPPPYFYTL